MVEKPSSQVIEEEPESVEKARPQLARDELWRWSATRLAQAIKVREISSCEAVTSCLERIAAVNPLLNALVEVRAEEALEAARNADNLLAAGEPSGPLHGVPTSTKINSDQAGYATTNGVVAFANEIPPRDSPQARNLRDSGAVLLGRSNSPAFSYRWFSNNELHGKTLNPWDQRRTPGGSSGGAGSAVASGMLPLAQGNDIGGSVRYPAYACGVVGLRPTVGRVAGSYGPRDGDHPLSVQTMLVQGPLARTVDDLRLALDGMSGYDSFDPVYVPGAPAAVPSERPLRVGVLRDPGVVEPSPPVSGALDASANWLSEAGYQVDEVDLPLLAEAYRLWWLLAMEEFRELLPLVEESGDEAIKTSVAHTYSVAADWWGPKPGLGEYMRGYARRGTLIRQLQSFMEQYPLILLPVSAEPAFEQDADIVSVEATRRIMAANWSMMAIPLLGFPALSVPTGVLNGLPTGVQLLARRFDEPTLLDAGNVIESRAGTNTPIDPR